MYFFNPYKLKKAKSNKSRSNIERLKLKMPKQICKKSSPAIRESIIYFCNVIYKILFNGMSIAAVNICPIIYNLPFFQNGLNKYIVSLIFLIILLTTMIFPFAFS